MRSHENVKPTIEAFTCAVFANVLFTVDGDNGAKWQVAWNCDGATSNWLTPDGGGLLGATATESAPAVGGYGDVGGEGHVGFYVPVCRLVLMGEKVQTAGWEYTSGGSCDCLFFFTYFLLSPYFLTANRIKDGSSGCKERIFFN